MIGPMILSYFPESVCDINSKINNIKSSKTNKVNGWIFDIDRGPCPWNCFYSNLTNIGTCGNASWFGWKDGSPVGSIRSQSFTSLVVELREDIKIVSSFSRCLNGTFTLRNCSVKTLVH